MSKPGVKTSLSQNWRGSFLKSAQPNRKHKKPPLQRGSKYHVLKRKNYELTE